MAKDDLIIPEMEKIENIHVVSKHEENENKKEKEIEKIENNTNTTNTEDFMNYLKDSIQKMIDIKKRYKQTFLQLSVGNLWGFMNRSYFISMPRSKDHNRYLSAILSKVSKYSGADCLLTIGGATDVVIKYLKYLEKKFNKLINKKRPFLNNQNFAEQDDLDDEYLDEEINISTENLKTPKINDNERMNFITDGIDTVTSIRDTLLSFDLLDSYTINTIQEVLNSYINGLKKAKKYAVIRLKRGWSFSELTTRLDTIKRGL